DADDVFVAKGGDDAGLLEEGVSGAGPGKESSGRHLDRDGPLQVVIAGKVDDAKASLAQNALNAIAADAFGPIEQWRGRVEIALGDTSARRDFTHGGRPGRRCSRLAKSMAAS